jgi:hypothetical protein
MACRNGGHVRVAADGVADHERGHRDAVLVEEVQEARDALAGPVLIEGVLPEVGEAEQDRLGDRAARAADRLSPGLELHGHAHRQPGIAWPEAAVFRHRRSPFSLIRYPRRRADLAGLQVGSPQ